MFNIREHLERWANSMRCRKFVWRKTVRVFADGGKPIWRWWPRVLFSGRHPYWGMWRFSVYWLGREFNFAFGEDKHNLYWETNERLLHRSPYDR